MRGAHTTYVIANAPNCCHSCKEQRHDNPPCGGWVFYHDGECKLKFKVQGHDFPEPGTLKAELKPHDGSAGILEACEKPGQCEDWCYDEPRAWKSKCFWTGKLCYDCPECAEYEEAPSGPGPDLPKHCKSTCMTNAQPWSTKCSWDDHCGACVQCDAHKD